MKKIGKMEKKEFISQWLLPNSDFQKRVTFIKKELAKYIAKDPYFEEYFQLNPIKDYIDNCYYFANFSKISNQMLKDYIEAGVRFALLMNDKKQGKIIKRLLNPILDILTQYADNNTFLELLIDSEITGDEKIIIENINNSILKKRKEIPISKKAIKLHIKKRMTHSFAIKTEHIVNAKLNFENYIENLYVTENENIDNNDQDETISDPIPTSFDELFYDTDTIQDCIDILKKVDPPILNINEKFIGTYKSSFCIWFDVLKREGYIKHLNRSIYAKVISERFAPFKISEGLFGKMHPRAEEIYKLQIKTLLSQLSQKRK